MFRVFNNKHRKTLRILSFYVINTTLLLICAIFIRSAQCYEKRTKLCADPECKTDLFPSHFTRDWSSTDVTFLKASLNFPLKVVAFKFSNRPDIMEAEIEGGQRGFIFASFIDLVPYVLFLESALKQNQTLYMVEHANEFPKLIKEVSAVSDLSRDYMTYASKVDGAELDKSLVNMLLEHEEEQRKKAKTQHHHHHHHRHDHGHEHEHPHENTERPNEQQTDKQKVPIEEAKLDEIDDNEGKTDNIAPMKVTEEVTISESTINHKQTDDLSITTESIEKTTTEEKIGNEVQSEQQQPKVVEQQPRAETVVRQETVAEAQNMEMKQNPEESQIQAISPESPLLDQQQQEPKSESNEQKSKETSIKPMNTEQIGSAHQTEEANKQTEQHDNVQPDSDIRQQNQQIPPISQQNNIPPQQLPLQQLQEKQHNPPSSQQQPSPPQPSSFDQQNDQQIPTNKAHAEEEPLKNEKVNVKMPMEDPILKTLSFASTTPQPAPNTKEESRTIDAEKLKSFDAELNEQKSAEHNKNQIPVSTTETPEIKISRPIDVDLGPSKTIEPENPKLPTPVIDPPPPLQQSNDNELLKQFEKAEGLPKEEKVAKIAEEPLLMEQRAKESGRIERDSGEQRVQQQQKYCYKDNCEEFDDKIASEYSTISNSTTNSSLRTMFHNWMASLRALLPGPFCHFEDTGLIVLAFVTIVVLIQLINRLLSSSSEPEPCDHRVLHDCINRLKEQDLIIEKSKKNAALNQHLLEAANSAEHLQKQNETLDQRLKSAERRTLESESENGKLKQTLNNTRHELDQNQALNVELKASIEAKDNELKKLENNLEQAESGLNDTMNKLAQSQNREKYLEQDLKEASANLERVKAELGETQKEMEKWRNESSEKMAEIDELLAIVAELNEKESKSDHEEVKRMESKKGTPKKKKNNGGGGGGEDNSSSAASSPGQPVSLLDAIELDPENGAGSGGSAGWSDLGDGIEIPSGELESSGKTVRTSSPIERGKEEKEGQKQKNEEEKQGREPSGGGGGKILDILEMAKLKTRLRSLETERDQIKFSLKVEREENESLQKELEELRQKLVEKERDSEQRELDRHGLTQQCTKLLGMIEEKEKKVEYSEQEREKLRTRLSEIELEFRRVEDDKREVHHRFKEVEQSLKQSKELNGRLENKLYHEERRLSAKIRQLEEQLTMAKTSLSPVNMSGGGMSSDLNMSGNSSDRDFVPLRNPESEVLGDRSGVPSLWSEIDATEPVDELVSLDRKANNARRRSMRMGRGSGDVGRESPFLNDIVHVNKSGREERLLNSSKHSGLSVQSSTTAAPRQRMRSRSTGRQSVARLTGISANPYGTIGTSLASTFAHRSSVVPYQSASGKNSPFRQVERPHSAARFRNVVGAANTSSANYYSSDSNEASSPPPEMPLLSGVPPPGLNKRPAVVLPAHKLNVQIHKPAAAPK